MKTRCVLVAVIAATAIPLYLHAQIVVTAGVEDAADRDALEVQTAFVQKMIAQGSPELAESQAQQIVQRNPGNGQAWAVLASANAKRGNWAEGLRFIVNAFAQTRDDEFVLRTAGELVGWMDMQRDKSEIPVTVESAVNAMRPLLAERGTYVAAYKQAQQDISRAEAQAIAESERSTSGGIYRVASSPTDRDPGPAPGGVVFDYSRAYAQPPYAAAYPYAVYPSDLAYPGGVWYPSAGFYSMTWWPSLSSTFWTSDLVRRSYGGGIGYGSAQSVGSNYAGSARTSVFRPVNLTGGRLYYPGTPLPLPAYDPISPLATFPGRLTVVNQPRAFGSPTFQRSYTIQPARPVVMQPRLVPTRMGVRSPVQRPPSFTPTWNGIGRPPPGMQNIIVPQGPARGSRGRGR